MATKRYSNLLFFSYFPVAFNKNAVRLLPQKKKTLLKTTNIHFIIKPIHFLERKKISYFESNIFFYKYIPVNTTK